MNQQFRYGLLFLTFAFALSAVGMLQVNSTFNCNDLTQETWNKSLNHGKYKTLEDFKKACNELANGSQIVGGIMPLLSLACIVTWFITGRKHKSDKTSEKERMN